MLIAFQCHVHKLLVLEDVPVHVVPAILLESFRRRVVIRLCKEALGAGAQTKVLLQVGGCVQLDTALKIRGTKRIRISSWRFSWVRCDCVRGRMFPSFPQQQSMIAIILQRVEAKRRWEGSSLSDEVFGSCEVHVTPGGGPQHGSGRCLVALLGESHWSSAGKPLLLIDPSCVSTAQLPGSVILWMSSCRGCGGQSNGTNLTSK